MSCDGSIVSKQHVSDKNLPDFCFGSKVGEVEQPSIGPGVEIDPLLCCAKNMLQKYSKVNPKEGWGELTALCARPNLLPKFKIFISELRPDLPPPKSNIFTNPL